jgi:hypothetical protein
VIHADNARLHCAKAVALFGSQFSTPSTSYSLFPRSGYLRLLFFRYLKGMLQWSSFDEPDEPLSAIQEILSGIDDESLDAAFQEWMIRLQKCIDRNVEYVEYVEYIEYIEYIE